MVKNRLVALLLAVSLLTVPAYAATPEQQSDAALLHSLGLLAGAEDGDALDRAMTRAEGAVMLVRLFGAEENMPAQTYPIPFTDVPDWAVPYVSWLYQNNWTQGTSSTTFSPGTAMTCDQYMLFLGRALGYSDNQTASGKTFLSAATYQAGRGQTITRGQAVSLTVDALFATRADGKQLAQALAEQGALDAELLEQAADERPIIPTVDPVALQDSTWQVVNAGGGQYQIVRRQNGRERTVSEITVTHAITETGADGIFGYTEQAIYYFDPQTLQHVMIGEMPAFFSNTAQASIDALGSVNGTTLFYFCEAGQDYRFYTWSPSQGWHKVLDYTGSLTDINSLSTVEGKYFSGAFGILSLSAAGNVEVLTRTPCYTMTLLGGILYFIPNDPAEQANGYSNGGRQVRMLAMGQESVVLTLPNTSAYPICLETVTGATAEGVITARGTWHDRAQGEWHVMFSGKGDDVQVVDADNQHNVPNDLDGLYSAYEHMQWWADTLGLSVGHTA